MKKSSILFIASLLILALAAAGCGSQSTNNGEVVAEVNDKKIYREELDKQMEQVKASYEQQGQKLNSEENQEQLKELEKQVLEEIINNTVLMLKAEEAGIEASNEEVNNEIEKLKSQFESDEKYQQALEENNVTEEDLKDDISEQLTAEKYIQEQISEEDISISDEEIRDYYDKMKKQSGEEIGDFEELKPQIKQMMQQQEMQSARSELLENIKKDMDIKKHL